MANKKLGPIEVDERVFGDAKQIVRGLENLAGIAADRCDLIELFSNAIVLLFQQLPNGDKNYCGEIPRIGIISADNHWDIPGRLDLMYTHSGYRASHRQFVQYSIAQIDLRSRTAELEWKPGQYRRRKSYHIPAVVRRDTEYILQRLGLRLSGPNLSKD